MIFTQYRNYTDDELLRLAEHSGPLTVDEKLSLMKELAMRLEKANSRIRYLEAG